VIASIWSAGLLRHRLGRLAGMASAVGLVVALVGSLGAFVVFARADVSRHAAADLDIDWQVRLNPPVGPQSALDGMDPSPGVVAHQTVGYGDALGFQTESGETVQTTGAGKVVGMPPSYRQAFPKQIRDLVGASQGVLLAQQTAANLHAGPGDVVKVSLPGRPEEQFKVDGIVDLPNADQFFQAVGSSPSASPQAPPDNVLLIPLDRWRQTFDPTAGRGFEEVHVRIPRRLPPDPAEAFTQVVGTSRNYEVRMAGGAVVGDNLAARLDAARKDAAYGTLLFLFLGLPGVAAGLALVFVAVGAGAERRRAEQALLAARGASPAQRLQAAGAEAMLIGVIGSAGGLLVACLAAEALWHEPPGRVLPWLVAAGVLGVGSTLLAVLLPLYRRRGMSVSEARRRILQRDPSNILLAAGGALTVAAGLVVWSTTRSGYNVVVAPEGVPTISVSYAALAGPALAWLAGTLVLGWFAGRALGSGSRVVKRAVRPLAGGLAGLVASWLVRLRSVVLRSVTLLAIAVAFAVSTSIFNASFRAQSEVDAELTNGADVAAFAPQGVDLAPSVTRIAAIKGVAAVETMQHRFSYVGNDLQDLYGIRPGRIQNATAISDAYFAGGHAGEQLSKLNGIPDGVFVSDETVNDFQLKNGDTINLRLLDAVSHSYVAVPFHILGVVREFPSAPTDSFLVANASYISRVTHSGAAETLLVRTSRSPAAVGGEVLGALPPSSGARVQDIVHQRKITATGLVAVDLSGLAIVDLAFGSLVTLWAVSLMLSVGLTERRQGFVILRALGARMKQVGAFVVAEAGVVFVLGSIAGAALGGIVAWILVKVLQGVFDPPPQHLFLPWPYLAALAGSLVIGLVAATAANLKRLRDFETSWLRDQTL
jgi:putative ABC transport system permease protein